MFLFDGVCSARASGRCLGGKFQKQTVVFKSKPDLSKRFSDVDCKRKTGVMTEDPP